MAVPRCARRVAGRVRIAPRPGRRGPLEQSSCHTPLPEALKPPWFRPTRPRAALRLGTAAALYAVSASLAAVAPAAAQNLPLIRDTEIENLLKDYSLPIFKAAGLGSQNISMRLVRHDSFNAFVVDGHNVFVNTGTLMQAKT